MRFRLPSTFLPKARTLRIWLLPFFARWYASSKFDCSVIAGNKLPCLFVMINTGQIFGEPTNRSGSPLCVLPLRLPLLNTDKYSAREFGIYLYPGAATRTDIRIRIPPSVIRIPALRPAIRPIIPIAAAEKLHIAFAQICACVLRLPLTVKLPGGGRSHANR